MLVIGIIVGFFIGAVTVACIGLGAMLYNHRDCGKDWWKDGND